LAAAMLVWPCRRSRLMARIAASRALPATRRHAGYFTRSYDIAGHSLTSRLCRVPAGCAHRAARPRGRGLGGSLRFRELAIMLRQRPGILKVSEPSTTSRQASGLSHSSSSPRLPSSDQDIGERNSANAFSQAHQGHHRRSRGHCDRGRFLRDRQRNLWQLLIHYQQRRRPALRALTTPTVIRPRPAA
jgi:hypothetical protein